MNTRTLATLAFVAGLLATAAPWAAAAQAPLDTSDCIIKPNKVVDLSVAVSGVVGQIGVERGDPVKAGQLLAGLDSRVEEANVAVALSRAGQTAAFDAARAQFEMHDRRLKRMQQLYDNKHLAERNYEEAEADRAVAMMRVSQLEEERRVAHLEVERARRILETRLVRSPIDGVVTARHASPGEYVEGRKVLTVAQIDPLTVEIVLPTRLLGRIAPGMAAVVEPEAPVGGRYEAQVTIVDQVVDAASGTFGVQLRMGNPDRRTLAGLRCRAEFEIRQAAARQG